MLTLLLLRQLALGLLSIAVAYGLGSPVLRLLRLPASPDPVADSCERFFFAAVCGVGLGCVFAAALCAGHVCYRPALWLIVPAGVWGLRWALLDRGALRRLLLILALCTPMLLCTLLPPSKSDAVAFHLPYAQLLLQEHCFPLVTHLRYPYFPLYGEMLLLLGLSVDDLAAQAMSWLCLYLLAVGVFAALLRRSTEPAAWLGVVVVLANRVLCILGAIGYIDISVSLFVLGAALAFLRLAQGPKEEAARWLLLCGGLLGLAIGTKYTALVYAAILFGLLLCSGQGRAALGLAVCATLVGGCWYLRSWLHTGNPVLPFLRQVFGLGTLWSAGDYQAQFQDLSHTGPPRTLLGLLRVPRYLSFAEEMGGGPLEVSPLLWVGLLGVLAGSKEWLRGRARSLWLVPVLYAAAWFLTFDHVRYFAPDVALLSLLAGAGLWGWATLVRGRWLRGLLLAVFVVGGLGPAYVMVWQDLRNAGGIPVTQQARAAYLSRKLPDYQGTVRAAARPGVTYGLYLVSRYYGAGKVIGEDFGPDRFTDVLALLDRPLELRLHLLRLGASGLFIHLGSDGLDHPVSLGPPFRLLYQDPHTQLYEF